MDNDEPVVFSRADASVQHSFMRKSCLVGEIMLLQVNPELNQFIANIMAECWIEKDTEEIKYRFHYEPYVLDMLTEGAFAPAISNVTVKVL